MVFLLIPLSFLFLLCLGVSAGLKHCFDSFAPGGQFHFGFQEGTFFGALYAVEETPV